MVQVPNHQVIHCKKKVIDFPVPSRDGKIDNLFLLCHDQFPKLWSPDYKEIYFFKGAVILGTY